MQVIATLERENMIKYRSFRDQFKYCMEENLIMRDYHPLSGAEMLYCKLYETECHSGVCREDRIKISNQPIQATTNPMACIGETDKQVG